MAIHAGYEADAPVRSVAVPIYQTVAFEFDSAEHAAALFDLEAEGFRYSRISNPTTAVLERRLTALEGGTGALCLGSGQAALHNAVLSIADVGRNIVCVPQIYGTTHTLFSHVLPQMGVTARFGASDGAADLEPLIDRDTIAVFCESVGNPAGNVCDIEALATMAHAHGVPLMVDNTVASPVLLRPIDFGADIVIESLTKFLGGHGTTLGGAIIDGGRFPWRRNPERFPMLNRPDPSYHGLVYAERFGPTAYIERCRNFCLRTTGAALAPMSAFLLLQGIETVALRVERHVANARRVAEALRRDPRIDWIAYAGFADSPYYPLVQKYLGGNACSLLTFGVHGGARAGTQFYDALRLVKRLVNLGDAKSVACHPASTTHRQMNREQQRKAGITPETIRLSVGIEHIDDILADIDQALAAAQCERVVESAMATGGVP
jgi:O-acetylhomoserine (thiol)-lyase